jgi:hypothetical protein
VDPAHYAILALALLLLVSLGRVVWRRGERAADWTLVVAFVRLDFPPQQRDMAQKIAAGLAEIVGVKIKQLRPEHSLKEIAGWADQEIRTEDLIKVLTVAFGVACAESTTFRELVEAAAKRQLREEIKI